MAERKARDVQGILLGLAMAVGAVCVACVLMLRYVETQLLDRSRLDLRHLRKYAESFFDKRGRYPSTEEGFQALVDVGLLEGLPEDPWGRRYHYRLEGDTPVFATYGRDGVPGGEGASSDLFMVGQPRTAPSPSNSHASGSGSEALYCPGPTQARH